MRPGQTTKPLGTSTTVDVAIDGKIAPDARDPVAVDQQVERAVAPVRRVDEASAFQQAFSTWRTLISLCSTSEQIQHRHAHRDAVGDLLEDDGIRPVGDV